MDYIEGFVVAVPTENKQRYLDLAKEALPFFKKHGATRLVEAWGAEVPRGEVNDLWRAVQATDDESIVFSWAEFPDKAARDQGQSAMMADADMQPPAGGMPFDGKRMIHGGFKVVLDEGGKQRGRFIDSHILPVPENKRDDYLRQARGLAALALEAGALRVVDAWEDDVPHGKVTDFHRATLVRDDERIVFSWIEWPSAEVRDQAWQRLMTDPRMQALMENSAFDGQRVIWGSFETILDS